MLPFGLAALREEVVACRQCPRLAEYLAECRRCHPEYWARPVPGFGDPQARLLVVGLAPALHGGNRHGRVFTGDSSGAWLWRALHELGLASAPDSPDAQSPLAAYGVYVTNAVRCVPPGNRPAPAEIAACSAFLKRELELLPEVRVILALGRIAHDACVRILAGGPLSAHPFAHGAAHELAGRPEWLVDTYHPSRQNTNTRVLTWEMWAGVIARAAEHADIEIRGAWNAARGGYSGR
jgi:uracil-DNA glycosylase family 4